MSRPSLFLSVSFGVSWGLWLPLVLGVGLPPWYYYLGALGPALGSLCALGGDRHALRTWVEICLVQPGNRRVWVGLLAGSALAFLVAVALEYGLNGTLTSLEGLGRTAELPDWPPFAVLLLLTASYGFCEEVGWRGWLFAAWSRAWGHRRASLAVGSVWCLWHLPAFFCNPTYQALGWTAVFWALSLLAGSVFLSWLMLESGGSLWPVVAWHAVFDFLTISDSSGAFVAPVFSMAVLLLAPVAWRRLRTS